MVSVMLDTVRTPLGLRSPTTGQGYAPRRPLHSEAGHTVDALRHCSPYCAWPSGGKVTDYSHSRLATFEDCPRKFRYRYVDDIKVDGEGVEAFMGKRVHEILERLYHHV